jgi:predicted DNA-binding protein YlxM (UPF0122 family)
MSLDRDSLAKLYKTMSVGEIAEHLDVPRSTVYYNLKKFKIATRDKSQAQKLHIENYGHQRQGSQHSDETKQAISESAREFWDSKNGQKQRESLAKLRKQEWENKSRLEKRRRMNKLTSAPRPSPGGLSKFGEELFAFLDEEVGNIRSGVSLTADHVSDIILDDHKVVLELILPMSAYGDESAKRLQDRYKRLTQQLNSAGYRVIIIEQISNSISRARCQRVLEKIEKFCEKNRKKFLTIQS